MPALATITDLSARTPGGVDSGDVAAQAALTDAQALVIEEVQRGHLSDEDLTTWYEALTTTQQSMLRSVVCASARRCLDNPAGLTQEALGPYSQQQANSSPDVYLTRNELRQVRRLRPTGSISTARFTRGRVGPVEEWPTLNAIDGSAGEPIAFSEPDTLL